MGGRPWACISEPMRLRKARPPPRDGTSSDALSGELMFLERLPGTSRPQEGTAAHDPGQAGGEPRDTPKTIENPQ